MRIREISLEATGEISLFFAFWGFAFSVTSCDAQLRVKRGSGGLGAEPTNKQEASAISRGTACKFAKNIIEFRRY